MSTILSAFLLAVSVAGAEPPPSEPGDATLSLRLSLEYRPAFRHGEEIGDLYLYLDGRPLAWVARGGQMAPTPEVRFESSIGPGPHVLRLAMERHERRSGGEWSHHAQVAPLEIFFQLAAAGDVELDLRLIESRSVFASGDGPLAVTVTQGGRVVQNLERTGTAPAEWPALCEEIEANLPADKKVPRKIRARLATCVRWASLWRSLEGDVPSREEARAVLERYDFQPRFAGSLAQRP